MTSLVDELGFFTAMPETVIELWPEIGTDAVALFLYLRYRTNRERGIAFPSYATIAKDTGWGRRRISAAIKILNSDDYRLMSRRKRFGKSTEYSLRGRQIPLSLDFGDTPSSRGTELLQSRNATTMVAERDSNQTEIPDRSTKAKRGPNQHDAILICRRVVERYPPRVWAEKIVDAVGSDPANLARWEATVTEWIGRGHNKTNWSSMLEVFRDGWRSPNGARPPSAVRTPDYSAAKDVADFRARKGIQPPGKEAPK